MSTRVHVTVTREEVAEWCRDKPMPDNVVEAVTKVAKPGAKIPMLAYEVVLRVRMGRPIPPGLQAWYNAYTADGGRVPKVRPDRKERDRIEVDTFEVLFGMSRAEAIRYVAEITHREPKSVESNLYR